MRAHAPKLVSNDPAARRVFACAESRFAARLEGASATSVRLSRADVDALFQAAKDERTGRIDAGAALALRQVRAEYSIDDDGAAAFDSFWTEYGLDVFLTDLKAKEDEAKRALARAKEDWEEFREHQDKKTSAAAHARKKEGRLKAEMKRLGSKPLEIGRATTFTGNPNPHALIPVDERAPSDPDPADVAQARADRNKTKL